MEYCSRGSLYDVLKDETISIDWNRLFGIIIEAVKGILCLHSWKPQVCDFLFLPSDIVINPDCTPRLEVAQPIN